MFDILKFGLYISKLRKAADMTQSELADKINLTRQAISKYERGESFPDVSILIMIADVFNVSVESIIGAGGPTKAESEILLYQSSAKTANMGEIINIAPFLKPSVLDKIVIPFKKQGIDLSHIIELSEYMNAKSVEALAESTSLQDVDPELLKRLIPVLSEDSKLNIFEMILDGKIDWHLISTLTSYMEYIRPLIEAAVLEGVLPIEVLK